MKNRPSAANEPKDLSKEWHSDSKVIRILFHICSGSYLLKPPFFFLYVA